MLIFRPSKLGRTKYVETTPFLLIEITSNKVCQNDADLSPVEITSNKARQNKNVRELSNILGQNDVDFSLIEITSKQYVELMWTFIDFFFWTYRRHIDIERGACTGS